MIMDRSADPAAPPSSEAAAMAGRDPLPAPNSGESSRSARKRNPARKRMGIAIQAGPANPRGTSFSGFSLIASSQDSRQHGLECLHRRLDARGELLSHFRRAGLNADQDRVRHPLALEGFHEKARRHSVRAEPGSADLSGAEHLHLARPAVEVHRIDEGNGVRSFPKNGGEETLEGRPCVEDPCAQPATEPSREDGPDPVVGPAKRRASPL